MDMEFIKFYADKHKLREGWAQIEINKKLAFLFVVTRDRESGDLKTFVPGPFLEGQNVKYFGLPFDTIEKAKKLILEKVNVIFDEQPEPINNF